MQIFTGLTQMAKNKYFWALKNIGWNFYLLPIFLEKIRNIFLGQIETIFIWVISRNDSEGFTNPHFKFKWNLNMMHTWLASLEHTRTRDVATRPHSKESRPEIQGSAERKWGTQVEDDLHAPR